ncbi:MAG TPA: tetratricopeptide repeat protein [Candidatus Polarisedimenticolaceae bacterium]
MRRLLAVAALVLVASRAAADADQAQAWFKAGRYLEAAAEYQSLVERSPGWHYGWFMLGHCLLKMDRPADAEPAFRRALAISGEKAEYYYGLAAALRDGGRPGPAIEVLSIAEPFAREAKARYAIFYLRGTLLAAVERWSEAVIDLERARALHPDPAVLDQLGRAYAALGRWDRAASILAESLVRDPDNEENRRLRIDALLRLGAGAVDEAAKRAAYAEAFEQAQIHARAHPEDTEAANLLGRAAMGAGRYEVAEQALRRVLEMNPRYCPATINLGRVLLARAELERAIEALQRGVECAPRLPAAHEALGLALLRVGRFQDALAVFGRAQALHPSPVSQAGIDEARRRLGASDPNLRTVDGPPAPRR